MLEGDLVGCDPSPAPPNSVHRLLIIRADQRTASGSRGCQIHPGHDWFSPTTLCPDMDQGNRKSYEHDRQTRQYPFKQGVSAGGTDVCSTENCLSPCLQWCFRERWLGCGLSLACHRVRHKLRPAALGWRVCLSWLHAALCSSTGQSTPTQQLDSNKIHTSPCFTHVLESHNSLIPTRCRCGHHHPGCAGHAGPVTLPLR